MNTAIENLTFLVGASIPTLFVGWWFLMGPV